MKKRDFFALCELCKNPRLERVYKEDFSLRRGNIWLHSDEPFIWNGRTFRKSYWLYELRQNTKDDSVLISRFSEYERKYTHWLAEYRRNKGLFAQKRELHKKGAITEKELVDYLNMED